MKTIYLAVISFSIPLSPLFAEETSEASSFNPAHIIGELNDGTPPPPEPPKPGFTPDPNEILSSETFHQGGRKITIREILPIDLPEPPPPVAPTGADLAEAQAASTDLEPAAPDQGFLLIGATIFHAADGTVRSLVNITPMGGGEPVTFWSSADFALFSGMNGYAGADGITRSLIMSWGREDIENLQQYLNATNPESGSPPLPNFPIGPATFTITTPNLAPETLANVQSLHDLYNNEHARLLTAFQGREQARLQQEAELKANPPKPKDLILNFWDGEVPAAPSQEGTTR